MPISNPSPRFKVDLRNHWLARYVFALMAVVVAAFLREGLTSMAGGSLPTYITFYPAVMLTALLGGMGPGLLATVVVALGVDYYILPPQRLFAVASLADAVGLAFFTGTGVFMSVVAELYRRARQQSAAQKTEALLGDRREARARWTKQGLLINAGLVLSLAILAGAGWQSAQNLRAVEEGDKSVTRAYVVIQEFDRLNSALKDEETGQRGYLLTGDERYLEPYEAALSQVQINLAGLKQMATGNAAHQQRLADIEALILKKEAVIKQTVELRRSQGLPAALEVVKTDQGKNLMDQIRNQVAEAQEDMNRVLQSQAAARNTDTGKTLQALLAGGVLSIILLVTVFLFLKQENIRRTKAEANVRHHRDHLKEMVAARTEELGLSNEQLKKEIAEHQQARESLRQQREWLSVTLTSIGDAVLATDTAGRITFLNPVAELLTGWPEGEALGRPADGVFRVINEQTRAPGEDIVAHALGEGRIVALANHTALLARDGREIPIEDSAAPIRDSGGTVSGVVVVFHDVTQKRQAENARTQLAAIVEGSDDAILSKDLDGTITSWNAGAERLFGYRPEEVIGRSIKLLLPPERQEEEAPIMARIQTDERVNHFETVRLAKDGRSLAVSVTISSLKDGGGRIIGASKIVRDISAWRRAERRSELLAQTASRLLNSDDPQRVVDELCGRVLEFLNCQVFFNFLVDEKQQRLHLNACAGITRPDAAKIEWLDHCAAVCGNTARDGCRFVAGSIQGTHDPRTELVKGFGIQAYACHPLMVAGMFLGTLSFGTRNRKDFTEEELSLMKAVADLMVTAIERKRAQAALQLTAEEVKRSNRDLEQFAYIASHDLQEPLRAVGGYVKLLQRRFPQNMDPKALEYIHGAADGAERMERLISDLLAFSRVGARGGAFSPADLDAILTESLHNLQAGIVSTRAHVTRDALPTLAVDATQMMQLFQNLIGNAIKFRGEQAPEIHVGARKEPGRWVFSVRDNGIGIEPQYFERIFQIFQRLHTRQHYAGTGIGLAICKKIVERHDGAIWVESGPGQGSTFFFSLPATSAITPPMTYDNNARSSR